MAELKLTKFWEDFENNPPKIKRLNPTTNKPEPINVAVLKIGADETSKMSVGACYFDPTWDNQDRCSIFVQGQDVTNVVGYWMDLDAYFYMNGIY